MLSENNSFWWGKHIQIFLSLLSIVMQKLKKYFRISNFNTLSNNQISTVADYVTILNTRGRLGVSI